MDEQRNNSLSKAIALTEYIQGEQTQKDANLIHVLPIVRYRLVEFKQKGSAGSGE